MAIGTGGFACRGPNADHDAATGVAVAESEESSSYGVKLDPLSAILTALRLFFSCVLFSF